MFEKIKRGGVALASIALAAAALGFATPALAVTNGTGPKDAYLTKVIDGAQGTDASGDTYTFHFAGSGTVAADGDTGVLMSGAEGEEVVQDSTLKVGDEVPQIADLVLKGKNFTDGNTITGGQVAQAVSRASLAYILGEDEATCTDSASENRTKVVFPHAGVYTYRVTESAYLATGTGVYVVKSNASYLLRITVKNGTNGTEVDTVTVEKEKNDEGDEPDADDPNGNKVDPTKPEVNDDGRITGEFASNDITTAKPIAGDDRGRDVNGFTFANEYVKGGQLVVEKSVQGTYGDKTKKFSVTLTILDSSAPAGSCITYTVSGGEDTTDGAKTLDGVENNTSRCVAFAGGGQALEITANLKDGGKITVTGLYGTLQPADEAHNNQPYRNRLTEGLKATTQYKVDETLEGQEASQYTPYGFVYPTSNPTDGTSFTWPTDGTNANFSAGKGTNLSVDGTASDAVVQTVVSNDGAYVYIVNVFDDNSVTPTGIIINNLPYVLMIGIPVAVFVGMFVSKRRHADDLA